MQPDLSRRVKLCLGLNGSASHHNQQGNMTVRERAFVLAFLGKAAGNATQAAILAGYSRRSARQHAHHLLTKHDIQQALVKREEQRAAQGIGDADARDTVLWSIANDPKASAGDRIRAIVELNRCSGRHSVTLHHKGRSLEDILAESREPRPATAPH